MNDLVVLLGRAQPFIPPNINMLMKIIAWGPQVSYKYHQIPTNHVVSFRHGSTSKTIKLNEMNNED